MKQVLLFLALLFSLQVGAQMIHREAGGAAAQFTVTEYTTPGSYTYTVPVGAIAIRAISISGGGAGASGRCGAAGTVRTGGTGGWSGSVVDAWLIGDNIDSSTYTVYVGSGGIGGAAITADNTSGLNGSDGGRSSFGPYRAPGGIGGLGGTQVSFLNPSSISFSNFFGGSSGVVNFASFSLPSGGGRGRIVSNADTNGSPSKAYLNSLITTNAYSIGSPGGGAGGLGVANTNVAAGDDNRGGGVVFADSALVSPPTNGDFADYYTAGGASGAIQGSGSNGVSHVARYYKYTTTAGFGTGGGGGGGSPSSFPAGDGGDGGDGGGGGGGGGGGTNGFGSGAGGDGGDGGVIIIAFF